MIEHGELFHHSPELPSDLPIIGLAGYTRAGKGVAKKVLEQNFSIRSITLSDLIREFASDHRIPLRKREDYWNTRILIDQTLGDDYLLRRSLEILGSEYAHSNQGFEGALIDGIRTPEVSDTFKKLNNSLLIAITAHPYARYLRKANQKSEDYDSFGQFVEYELQEAPDAQYVLEQADVTIQNEGTQEEFETEILEVVANRYCK